MTSLSIIIGKLHKAVKEFRKCKLTSCESRMMLDVIRAWQRQQWHEDNSFPALYENDIGEFESHSILFVDDDDCLWFGLYNQDRGWISHNINAVVRQKEGIKRWRYV